MGGEGSKRRFIRIAEGVPMWCGPGNTVHCAFHKRYQAGKVWQAVAALRQVERSYAAGWEGDRFVLSFKAGGEGC